MNASKQQNAALYAALGSLALARLDGHPVSSEDVRKAIFETTGFNVVPTTPPTFSIDVSLDGGAGWEAWSQGLEEAVASSLFDDMIAEGDGTLSLRLVDERDESLTKAHIVQA